MSREAVEVVRGMFDAYLRGDDEALLGFADPGVEIEPSSETGRSLLRGHRQFLEFWRDWETGWDDYFIETREFHDAGDRVVVVIYERGRGRGSGIVIDDEFAHVWTVHNGKVTCGEVFSHKRDALAAAGLGDANRS